MCLDLAKKTGFLLLLTLAAASCSSTSTGTYSSAINDQAQTLRQPTDQRFQRQVVDWYGPERPGTIIVNTNERFLYLVQSGGQAMRYGVGVGRDGFRWQGSATVGRKAEWPTWTPPKEMIERDPDLIDYSSGMPGGLDNPLGARAVYLYSNGKDTLYRLHGTNEPWSIGLAVSSGCIRLRNEDIVDLYERVPVGADVIVL